MKDPAAAFFLPGLFQDQQDIYWNLSKELGMRSENLLAVHNVKAHLKHAAPEKSAAFRDVVQRLAQTFCMKVEASRLNVYKSGDWKPLHHDHAGKVTATVGFGASRSIVFAHPLSGTSVGYTMSSGDAYAFGPDVNDVLIHGIARVTTLDDAGDCKFIFSVVVWGDVE